MIILFSKNIPIASFSSASYLSNPNHIPSLPKSCDCVIFRMDGIQDYWIEQGQIAPMDLFLSKNKSLTTGLQIDSIGNDSKIIDKVKEGFNKGFFATKLYMVGTT